MKFIKKLGWLFLSWISKPFCFIDNWIRGNPPNSLLKVSYKNDICKNCLQLDVCDISPISIESKGGNIWKGPCDYKKSARNMDIRIKSIGFLLLCLSITATSSNYVFGKIFTIIFMSLLIGIPLLSITISYLYEKNPWCKCGKPATRHIFTKSVGFCMPACDDCKW